MPCILIFLVLFLTSIPSALALDLPARRPGLWEVEIALGTGVANLSPQRAVAGRQCMDATVDQLFWRRDLGTDGLRICQSNVANRNGTITADLSCNIGPMTMAMHSVISGDYNSAYTIEITMTKTPTNGAASPPVHVTNTYRYIGPCAADQRPGDFITTSGRTLHLFGDRKPADRH